MELRELSEEQAQAIEGIEKFFDIFGNMSNATLAGHAGTGKTTVIAHMLQSPRFRRWKVLAPTGKAVSVLRSKGIHAMTVHQFAYRIDGHDAEGRPIFVTRDQAWEPPEGLIVDEASMIDQQMFSDILSFGLPVLFVGDHGQLPPVKGRSKLMANPRFVLKEVHRQASESQIIRAAHRVRGGEEPCVSWSSGEVEVVKGGKSMAVTNGMAANVDVIICATNSTRHRINEEWRSRAMGLWGDPKRRDRVICLQNDHSRKMYNGDIYTVDECTKRTGTRGNSWFEMMLISDLDGARREVDVSPDGFARSPKPDAMLLARRRGFGVFDFAYALTCHKAQGSEWDSVLVYDEPFDDVDRWRYTAFTRASKRLVIQIPGDGFN